MATEAPVVLRRLHGLDLIRGLCAFGVMTYHYVHFSGLGSLDGLGTYGVYVFFVLSGFAMAYRYTNDKLDEQFVKSFFAARALRIFPLFALVAILRFATGPIDTFSAARLLVNVTPLMGLGDPTAFSSLVVGGWSIMVEWAFYLAFPFVMLVRSVRGMACVFAFALLVNYLHTQAAYYPPAYVKLDRVPSFTESLTFLAYFAGGMLGARVFTSYRLADVSILRGSFPLIISLALLALIFSWPHVMPFFGRKAFLSGWTALTLILLSALLVYVSAIGTPSRALREVATFTGDISFALYLIHPYVYRWVENLIPGLDNALRISVSAVASIGMAYAIHRYFEKPIMRWGRKRPQSLAIT